eukprot:g18348.t1
MLLVVIISLVTGIGAILYMRWQSRAIETHSAEAHTDPLTGLFNRRMFDVELSRSLAQRQRQNVSACLMIIDIDNFKSINDACGHQVGDEALRHVAEVLGTQGRESDVAARIGGDEFAVILPGSNLDASSKSACRLAEKIREFDLGSEGDQHELTVSIGIAEADPADDTISLLRRADAVVVSVVAGIFLVVGLASSLVIAGRAFDNSSASVERSRAAAVQTDMMNDVNNATSFSVQTSNTVTFQVPDRDGDNQQETLSYSWNSTTKELTYSYNDTPAVAILGDVQAFNLTYESRTMTGTLPALPPLDPNQWGLRWQTTSRFGYESTFGTLASQERQHVATRVTLAESGTVKSISAYFTVVPAENSDVVFAIYSVDSNNNPGSLLAQTAIVNINSTGWVTIPTPDTPLTAGEYYLALSHDKDDVFYHFETGSGETHVANVDPFKKSGWRPVVISSLLVGMVLVASMAATGGVFQMWRASDDQQAARALARQMMSEILQQRYEEPNGVPSFGRESGEAASFRTNWDDVDDYHGLNNAGPQDTAGWWLAGYENWRRTVSVAYADLADPTQNSGADTGLKRITVVVTNPAGEQTTLVAYRSRWGAVEQPPAADTMVQTWLGSEIRNFASIQGNVEAQSYSGSNPSGTLTIPGTVRALPDSSRVFDYYMANGTVISNAALPAGGLTDCLLSPTNNPFGATNPDGIYIINKPPIGFQIKRCRIVGTLIVRAPGQTISIRKNVIWEPARPNFPALLVEGDLEVRLEGIPLLESDVVVNLNPAGTPWQGNTDNDTADEYPSAIAGIIYATNNITFNGSNNNFSMAITGVVIANRNCTVQKTANVTITHDATLESNPPPGFGSSDLNSIAIGSWRQTPSP